MSFRRLMAIAAAGASVAMTVLAMNSFQTEEAEWRKTRLAALTAEGGWLSLAGLFWLHEGRNPFGKDAASEIVLPDGPAHAGEFQMHAGKVTVSMNGANTPPHETKPDSEDAVKIGRLSLFVIKRGEKIGIRVKDPQSEARRGFQGLEYFPANEAYRVSARWVAEPKKIPILNILGQTDQSECPGYAVFRLHGQDWKLYPILETPDAKELFYIFRDQTAGKETYGAGRFFYSDMPKDGKVVLDFNHSYNPPCAFTPYATCPLPPPENKLAIRIEAGEKKYGR